MQRNDEGIPFAGHNLHLLLSLVHRPFAIYSLFSFFLYLFPFYLRSRGKKKRKVKESARIKKKELLEGYPLGTVFYPSWVSFVPLSFLLVTGTSFFLFYFSSFCWLFLFLFPFLSFLFLSRVAKERNVGKRWKRNQQKIRNRRKKRGNEFL